MVAGVAGIGVVAASSAVYLSSAQDHTGQSATAPSGRAITSAPVAPVSPPSGSASPTTPGSTSASSASTSTAPDSTPIQGGITLVAYQGNQLPGFTVTRIPAGYVLQGISQAVLDVSRKGDHSSLDSFVGKISVTVNDAPGPDEGQVVSVNGHLGRIRNEDGVQLLTYNDGMHDVEVQAWSDVKITPAQLVSFAEGVTVLATAQTSHG